MSGWQDFVIAWLITVGVVGVMYLLMRVLIDDRDIPGWDCPKWLRRPEDRDD